jgi:hypothetical protein
MTAPMDLADVRENGAPAPGDSVSDSPRWATGGWAQIRAGVAFKGSSRLVVVHVLSSGDTTMVSTWTDLDQLSSLQTAGLTALGEQRCEPALVLHLFETCPGLPHGWAAGEGVLIKV